MVNARRLPIRDLDGMLRRLQKGIEMDYKSENVWLMLGDCLERMKEIPDGSIDMVLTDPPYGTTACKWDSVIPLEPMWAELKRVVKPNGAIVLTAQQPFTSRLILSNAENFKYSWVWVKSKASGFFNVKKMPLKNIEDVCIFYSRQPTYNPQGVEDCHIIKNNSTKTVKGRHPTGQNGGSLKSDVYVQTKKGYPNQVLEFGVQTGLHPTQKPVALLEYLIKTYTDEGENVLDFTIGSGSTGVAAKNLNRKFIGIELDQDYFDVAKNRIVE